VTSRKLLSLVRTLPLGLRQIYGYTALSKAEYEEDDGRATDIDLVLKVQRVWDEIHREDPANLQARGMLAVARQRISIGATLTRLWWLKRIGSRAGPSSINPRATRR
jgi:hypothetical protein